MSFLGPALAFFGGMLLMWAVLGFWHRQASRKLIEQGKVITNLQLQVIHQIDEMEKAGLPVERMLCPALFAIGPGEAA